MPTLIEIATDLSLEFRNPFQIGYHLRLYTSIMTPRPIAIDLFSGCGGLSYGMGQAGLRVTLGIDHDRFALQSFSRNHPNSQTLFADISKLTERDFLPLLDNTGIDVLIGGPPCQGVSLSGHRIRKDPRNELFHSYLRILKFLRPKAFVMENVPGLVGLFDGDLCNALLENFERCGYTVAHRILNAADYGVPQARRRVFFVGLFRGPMYSFPEPLNGPQVNSFDAISDLPEGSVPDNTAYDEPAKSDYQQMMRMGSEGISNHQVTNHTARTISIISQVPDGGNYKDLPVELRDTRKVNIAWTRLNSSRPSFTVDTGHRHHFHYLYNRIPTVRENARLQSFPDSFIFEGSRTSQYRQVGNAVPPLLANVIGKALLEYL